MKYRFLFFAFLLFYSTVFPQEMRIARSNYTSSFIQADSNYILIPVIWRMDGKTSSMKIETYDEYDYKNIVFYNLLNDSCRQLFKDSLQLFHLEHMNTRVRNQKLSEYAFRIYKDSITGVQIQNTDSYNNLERSMLFNDFLLYKVVNVDYNKDEKLNNNDPVFLYASYSDGTNLKKLTPDKYSLKSYQFLKSNNMILAILTEDANNDHKFDTNDKEVVYKIDLSDLSKSKVITTLQIKNQ